jgi:hypothetical protein
MPGIVFHVGIAYRHSSQAVLFAWRKEEAVRVLRSRFFVPAVVFSLSVVSFRFGDEGAKWLWSGQVPVAVVLGAVAIFFWVLVGRDLKTSDSA